MKKKQPVKLQEYVYSEDEDFFTISTSQRTSPARLNEYAYLTQGALWVLIFLI
jgi:hypothetical protein